MPKSEIRSQKSDGKPKSEIGNGSGVDPGVIPMQSSEFGVRSAGPVLK
jgi:hypothetical protein